MISIIIPIYNSEKTLHRCVDSVLAQTYTDIEVILIDDGSTDSSPVICDNYVKADSRVQTVHKENAGVSAARNTGMDMAQGDYIAFVDSDDFIEPDMYEKMLAKASEYDCDVVLCDCIKEFGEEKRLVSHNIRAGFYNRAQLEAEYYPQLLINDKIDLPATISNWELLFKNKKDLPRYNSKVRYSEDLLFGAQLVYNANAFYYMKGEAFYHYIYYSCSYGNALKKDFWNDYQEIITEAEALFGNTEAYQMRTQLDRLELFLVYNSYQNIADYKDLKHSEKIRMMRSIRDHSQIKKMFSGLSVHRLPVSWKLKVYTYLFKYRLLTLYLIIYAIA